MPDITLHHAPNTRSSGVLALLEELGAPYDLDVIPRDAEGRAPAAFLAVNPLGKVPAITDRGRVVTEQVAIAIHLADRFPAAALAPAIGDPDRGPYLRWLVTYAASFEPALVDRAMGREPGARAMSPYGAFDPLFGMIVARLARGPYLLGGRFTAADVLWGSALGWMLMFKLLPETAEVPAYVARVTGRPSFARAREIDAGLVARAAGADA